MIVEDEQYPQCEDGTISSDAPVCEDCGFAPDTEGVECRPLPALRPVVRMAVAEKAQISPFHGLWLLHLRIVKSGHGINFRLAIYQTGKSPEFSLLNTGFSVDAQAAAQVAWEGGFTRIVLDSF